MIDTKIKEIIQRSYNVKSFRLERQEGSGFIAGQYLIVTLDNNLSKPLSISSSPTESGYIEFTKKITDSDFSKRLDSLKQGDYVKVRYPYGRFTLSDKDKKVVFLSGGIGITPVRSICKYVVDKKLGIDIILLYGNRTPRDIVFRDDFDNIQREYPLLKVVHILSEPDTGWHGRVGYINKDVIREEIPDFIDRKFFICGPPKMVDAMKGILLDELAISKENIITEGFAGY